MAEKGTHSPRSARAVFAPVLIILVGVAWLMNELDLFPSPEWLWTGFLGAAGLVLLLSGFTKVNMVAGAFLVVSSFFSALRNLGRMPLKYEVPSLIIALGVLLLIAEYTALPVADEEKKIKYD